MKRVPVGAGRPRAAAAAAAVVVTHDGGGKATKDGGGARVAEVRGQASGVVAESTRAWAARGFGEDAEPGGEAGGGP